MIPGYLRSAPGCGFGELLRHRVRRHPRRLPGCAVGPGGSEWDRGATVQMFKPNRGSVHRRIERSVTVIGRALFSALLLLVLWWLVSQGLPAI